MKESRHEDMVCRVQNSDHSFFCTPVCFDLITSRMRKNERRVYGSRFSSVFRRPRDKDKARSREYQHYIYSEDTRYLERSFDGPLPDPAAGEPMFDVEGKAGRHQFRHPNDDFVQAGTLYRKVMTETDPEHLIGNIVSHLGNTRKRIQMRKAAIFFSADEDYGRRVTEGLKLDIKEVQRLSRMTPEDRTAATVEEK